MLGRSANVYIIHGAILLVGDRDGDCRSSDRTSLTETIGPSF